MSTNVPEIAPARGARLQDVISGQPGYLADLKQIVVGGLKFVIGAFLCAGMFRFLGALNFIGAILVVGWTYRLMQRTALKVWWKRSPEWYDGVRFETLTSTHDDLREHRHWPNWFRESGRFLGSLRRNFMIGLAGVFNSYVLTLLPGLVWYLTWKSGWNNSFHFGYEQSFEAPGRFIIGMLLFAAIMFYVPMAQARQAVTGDWRSFFHFRRVCRIIGRSWPTNFLLAASYGILSLPVMVLTVAPIFFGQNDEKILDMSATELLPMLFWYQFFACLFVFPAFVFLHIAAAHIYARTARKAIQKGKLEPVGFEKVAVEKLHIDVPDGRGEFSPQTRFILWTGSMAGGITAAFFAFILWLAFSSLIVVGQFFKYEANPMKGWVNQPLIQMPWFDLAPKQLLDERTEERKAKAEKKKREKQGANEDK